MMVQLIETSLILARNYGVYADSEKYTLAQHPHYYMWGLDPQEPSWWKLINVSWIKSLEIGSIYDIKFNEVYEDDFKYTQYYYEE